MFDTLTDKLTRAMKSLRGQAKLTERNIEDALREVRMALLEADVHVQVAKAFLQRVKEKALGTEVLQGLNPAQQFIDVVYQELTAIMGGEAPERPLELAPKPPTVVMMVGLQGSGKTTTCGKLGKYLKKNGHFPLLVPADVNRPAAIEQLHVVARDAGVPSFRTDSRDPVAICRSAVQEAVQKGWDVVILDTAGRLHLDEIADGRAGPDQGRLRPHRDPVRGRRHDRPGRGALGRGLPREAGHHRGDPHQGRRRHPGRRRLQHPAHHRHSPSSSWATAKSWTISSASTPTAWPSGSWAWATCSPSSSRPRTRSTRRRPRAWPGGMVKNQFTPGGHALARCSRSRSWAACRRSSGCCPGMGQMKQQLETAVTDKRVKHLEAILNSMTPKERQNHNLLDGKRKRRIAAGSGRPVHEVNQLLKQFLEMKKMMTQMNNPSFMKRMQSMQNMQGMGKPPFSL